jgi:hypothetical protein
MILEAKGRVIRYLRMCGSFNTNEVSINVRGEVILISEMRTDGESWRVRQDLYNGLTIDLESLTEVGIWKAEADARAARARMRRNIVYFGFI